MNTPQTPSPAPRISVIIPARNEEHHIRNCIASILAADWPHDFLEILVIDHQSTDSTASLAHSCGARVIYASSEKGIGAVRNIGLDEAGGDFVAYVDADCIVPPTWLRTAVRIHDSDPKIGAVGGGQALAPNNGTWVERCLAPTTKSFGKLEQVSSLRTCSFIARTNVLRGIGRFNETLISGEDDDISNKLHRDGYTLIAASDCCVVHHGYPKSLFAVLKKEIWHGSNHIDVRSRFDITLLLTLIFLVLTAATIGFLVAAIAYPSQRAFGELAVAAALLSTPPALFAIRKLQRSQWNLRLLPPLLAVGYAHFIGHSLGLIANIRRILAR